MIPRGVAEQHGLGVLDGIINGRETLMHKLRQLLPNVVTEDGLVDVDILQNAIGRENITHGSHRHEIRFAGKGLANYLADSPTNLELSVEYNQSKDFDKTSNIVIRGDNLDALKVLRNNYHDSVKAIYIDPPYNTGNDGFVYNDDFKTNDAGLIDELKLDPETVERFQDLYGTKTHSGWLAFMYPRLKVARDLLADDGAIFISIDDNEQANLKMLCNEIFGESNFLSQLVVQTNPRGRSLRKDIAQTHEYVLMYAKNKEVTKIFKIPKSNDAIADYNKVDEYGSYRLLRLRNTGIQLFNRTTRPNLFFPIYVQPTSGKISLSPSPEFPIKVLPVNNEGVEGCWTWSKKKINNNPNLILGNQVRGGEWRIYRKDYLKGDSLFTRTKSILTDKTINHEVGKEALTKLFRYSPFEYPKSPFLIKKLISLVCNKTEIVLDFFAGSGTTGEAVMQLNAEDGGSRKFILVQIDEDIKNNKDAMEFCVKNRLKPVISSITLERLNRAGNVIHKEHPNEDIDIGYKVFSIADKPKIIADGAQTLLFSTQHIGRDTYNTLFNMLCATHKPLDTPIRMIVQDRLYEADGEMYVLGEVNLSKYKDRKINVNGWGETSTLEMYLNLPRSNVEVVY